jgi:hypothetical protein
MRKDLQTILDERRGRMEKDIAAIKAKIGLNMKVSGSMLELYQWQGNSRGTTLRPSEE